MPPGSEIADGMRLGIDEFERRATLARRLGSRDRFELLDGVVSMSPPPGAHDHAVPGNKIARLLGSYEESTPGTIAGDNGGFRTDRTWVGPDYFLLIDPACGGQIGDWQTHVALPELCVAIANTSLATDLTTKKDLYARYGTQEYLVHDVRG